MGEGSVRGCGGILHPQGWSVPPFPPFALCRVFWRSWIPALEPFIPRNPKSQPVLRTFGGPGGTTKDPSPLPQGSPHARSWARLGSQLTPVQTGGFLLP